MIGEQLGRYVVENEVGQGGMSVVYRGLDTVLKRPVAIKVLHPHLQGRAESRARFEREAVAVAKLSHPNILQIFDFSEADSDRSYIVTEFIEGHTLRTKLEDQPIEYPEIAAMIGVLVCDALAHAHDLGIIHRDIKPENVMICSDGTLKLMDFGIAQIVDAHVMTVTGTLLGSPAHMSPEMIEGLPLDFRADIFSLGTLIYFAATGELPFMGANPPLVLKAILEGNYIEAQMRNPRVGRALSRIIDRCLEREADDRFDSVRDLQRKLESFLADCELTDTETWVVDFFTNPHPTQAKLRLHLLEVLERRGREALGAGKVASALEYFNRVLAIEPEHGPVLKLIRSIDRRRKMMVYAGAAVLLLVAGAAVAWASSGPSGDASVDPPVVEDTPDATNALADQEATQNASGLADASHMQARRVAAGIVGKEEARKEVARQIAGAGASAFAGSAKRISQAIADKNKARDDNRNTPNPIDAVAKSDPPDAGVVQDSNDAGTGVDPVAENPLPDLVRVKFQVQYPKDGVRITLNGKPYTEAALKAGVEIPRTERITWVATHPKCITERRSRATLKTKNLQVNIKLRLKPATLIVNAGADKGATVQVMDGGAIIATGHVGQAISIPITDPFKAMRTIKVRVIPALPNSKPHTQTIRLKAAEPYSLSVNLQR